MERAKLRIAKKHEYIILAATLGAAALVMLYFSWISTFGDEEYFRQLSLDPLNIHKKLWFYGPIPFLLMWPIAKLTSNIFILRLPTIALSLTTVYLLYLVVKQRVGPYALAFVLPLAITSRLLIGAMWFYWDTFAMFFFALTLYLLDRHKWLPYIAGVALSLSKLFLGPLLLVVLATRRRSLAPLALLYVPIYLLGQPKLSYLSETTASALQSTSGIHHVTAWWLRTLAPELTLYILLTLPCLLLIRRYPTEVLFYLTTLAYSLAAGLGVSHTSTIIYSGILVFPLVVKMFVERRAVQRKHTQ